MSATRFLRQFATAAVLIAGVSAAVNVLVDPYLVFGTPRLAGFNAVKPGAETHEWMMKAYQSSRVQPGTVILGSSRSDIGFDPASTAWPSATQPVYNLSVVGSRISHNLHYLQHLLANEPARQEPKTLVVGLDFESFLYKPRPPGAPPPGPAPDETGGRLAVMPDGTPNTGRTLQQWKDRATATLSLDALRDSTLTLLANRASSQPDIEPNGHLSEGRFRQWLQQDGMAAMFEQKNAGTVRNFNQPRHRLRDDQGAVSSLQPIRQLIDLAHARQMRVMLLVQPSHATRMELMAAMGYWPAFEDWKTALTELVASEQAAGADVSLWDFGGYEAWVTEPVPADGDKAVRLRWFWDPVHYTAALGDVMIQRMLEAPGAPPFGALLRPDSLQQRLEQVRIDRARYRQQQAGEVARATRLVCKETACPAS